MHDNNDASGANLLVTNSDDKNVREGTAASLSLWDSVSLIVGIVIGSTIFKLSGTIFSGVPDPWTGLGLWLLCGALSFVGALCYAELATTYPRLGGEYNYLTRAFGPCFGFLFGWSELILIQTGGIGALSYIFAEYAVKFFLTGDEAIVGFALGAVVGLTSLNVLGVRLGKSTQNILTIAKTLGLVLLIVAGLSSISSGVTREIREVESTVEWSVAIILVLYAYGGWNDAAFVAANVRDPKRNIPKSLLYGVVIITSFYLLVNASFLATLGFEGLKSSQQPAADTMAKVFGATGERAISFLVMISALGSVNGLIFSVSRLHAMVGTDHYVFAWLGRWWSRTNAPVWSLLVQGIISVLMILGVGTQTGRGTVDLVAIHWRGSPIPWDKFHGGFNTLFAGTAPLFWLFFLANGLAYFVLRLKDPLIERPFRAPFFPLCPLLFCGMCLFGLYSATTYGWDLLPFAAGPVLLGLPVYFLSRSLGSR